MNKELRIAILIEHDIIPAWAYHMISKINDSVHSEIVILIEDTKPSKSESSNHFLYNLYTKLDQKYFKTKPNAFELKSLKCLLNLKILNITDIASIKEYNIDILIQLQSKALENEIVSLANLGVWYYYYGNNKMSQDTPDHFWEVIDRKGEVGISLVMQKSNQNKILAISHSLTDNLSVTRSKNSYYWKAASILPRKIDELGRLGEKEFFSRINKLDQNHSIFLSEIKSIPTNSKVFLKLIKFKWKRFRNILRSFFYFDQWILLYNLEAPTTISTNLSQFKKIIPPKDRFWADPHVIKKNNFYYIFIEELIYSENKGFISVIEMDSHGNYKDPVKILETDYHLSFPFIIEDNNEIYMVPESKQNNNIQLYKCVDFPYIWELETVLMDNVKAVDTVITKKDGKYWLFTNMIENEGASLYDELYLFSSDILVSNNWKSHPENPIVSDVKNARLAGKLFYTNNNLYRPSQNCSHHYGYGMHINEVIELNEINYKEKIVDSIYPNWDNKITSSHSLSNSDKLTVIDAQYVRRK